MSITSKLLSLVGLAAKAARQPFMSVSSAMGLGGAGTVTPLREYKNWVFACVKKRGTGVGKVKLRITDQNGDTVESHEALDLLYRVNDSATKFELFFGTQAFLDLDGNAFWFLARDNDGKGAIRAIYLLRPDRMSIAVSKDNPLTVTGYAYKTDEGKQIPFNTTEILHFKNFNPLGNFPRPHRGTGIVEAAWDAIEADNEARGWNKSFFRNSARPDGILYLDGDGAISEEDMARIRADWDGKFKGSRNASKTAILTGGVKWEAVTASQKDMDFVAQRNFSRDEILAMFEVPPSVLGIVKDVNRANAEASNYIFSLVVDDLMARIVETLNEFFLVDANFAGASKLEMTYESPVPEDRVQATLERQAGYGKWLSRNEIRQELGMPPTVDGDSFYGSVVEVPIDSVPPKQLSAKKPTAKASDAPAVPVNKAIDAFIAKLPEEKAIEADARTMTADAKAAYATGFAAKADAFTPVFQKQVVKFFSAQQDEVLANLERELKGLKPKEYSYKGLDDILFDREKAVGAAISFSTPFIRRFLTEGGEDGARLTGQSFQSNTERTAAFVDKRSRYFADTINETTAEELARVLKEGLAAGDAYTALADRIKEVYAKAETFRAEMIARTEVVAAANAGSAEAYKQAGIERHEWLAIIDNSTSDECIACDGKVEKLGEPFPSGETLPPNHPNCRCTTVPVF